MNNKENELLNGFIDIPNNESNTVNTNANLDYNFNFESQVEQNFSTNNEFNNLNNQTVSAENTPSVSSMPEVQMPVDISESIEKLDLDNSVVKPFIESPTVSKPVDDTLKPETLDFNNTSLGSQTTGIEMQSNSFEAEDKKQVNEELLKTLTADTNNFVNPDLIVNPSIKTIEEKPIPVVEEPTVNYEKINNKKKYVFMFILLGSIALFIAFLPKIVSLLGL